MVTHELHQYLLGRCKWGCLKCGSTQLERYGILISVSNIDISKWSYNDKGVYRCIVCNCNNQLGRELRDRHNANG